MLANEYSLRGGGGGLIAEYGPPPIYTFDTMHTIISTSGDCLAALMALNIGHFMQDF